MLAASLGPVAHHDGPDLAREPVPEIKKLLLKRLLTKRWPITWQTLGPQGLTANAARHRSKQALTKHNHQTKRGTSRNHRSWVKTR
jgi:hypothetical protein